MIPRGYKIIRDVKNKVSCGECAFVAGELCLFVQHQRYEDKECNISKHIIYKKISLKQIFTKL